MGGSRVTTQWMEVPYTWRLAPQLVVGFCGSSRAAAKRLKRVEYRGPQENRGRHALSVCKLSTPAQFLYIARGGGFPLQVQREKAASLLPHPSHVDPSHIPLL